MSSGVLIRTYSDAREALKLNLLVHQQAHNPSFTNDSIHRLIHYMFGPSEADNLFWNLVCWFKTFEPHDTVWHTFFLQQGVLSDKGTRSRAVKASLEQIKSGINSFCQEGLVLNDAMNLLEENFRKRLQQLGSAASPVLLPSGCSLVTEFRGVVKDSEEAILRMVEKGRPEKRDYLLDYMLAVSRHVFPELKPTGSPSNTFCLFAQAVFSACFYYEGGRSVSVSGLPNRVKICQRSGRTLFQYSEATDSFVATDGMRAENAQ